MNDVVVLDTNLMVLWVVGTASKSYITRHKRLSDYTMDDFDILGLLLAEFSQIVLLPHIVTDVSNIARQIENPARARIQRVLRTVILTVPEIPIPCVTGVRRIEYDQLGITDAVILHFCGMSLEGLSPTLMTADTNLANAAYSLGYSVIDYKAEYQTR